MCRILTTLALSLSLCCCYPPYRPSLYILYCSHPLRRIFWMGYLDKVLFSSPPPLHPMIFFSRAGIKMFSKKFSIRKCDILFQHFCKNPTFWWIFLRKKLTFSIDNSIFQRVKDGRVLSVLFRGLHPPQPDNPGRWVVCKSSNFDIWSSTSSNLTVLGFDKAITNKSCSFGIWLTNSL